MTLTVLLVHNRYQEPGGEDIAVEADAALLEGAGHRVVRYERDNDEIAGLGLLDRSLVAARTMWSGPSRRAVDDLIERVRPDVLHAHNTFPLVSPAVFAAARRRGVPVVQTLHNYRLICARAVLSRDGHVCHDCVGHAVPWPAVAHRCYHDSRAESAVVASTYATHRLLGTWRRLVTRHVAVSGFLARILTDAGVVGPDQIEVRPIPCVPDPGARAHAPPDGDFVFVGRLTHEKGIDVLMAAAAQAPTIGITVVGDGPDRPRAVPGNVRFLGRLPRAETFDVMRSARALVWPTISEEPFPTVLVEAAALGVPSIASGIGGAPEVGPSVLVPPGSPEALAAAMSAESNWPALGVAARAWFDDNLTPERGLTSLLGVYERAGVRA